jgi:hypothetical protein
VLREERFPGAHARRAEGLHGARRAGCLEKRSSFSEE